MIRRWLMAAFARAILTLAVKVYEAEEKRMAEEKCKHEGQEGKKFCAECGAKLADPEIDDLAEKVTARVLAGLKTAGIVVPETEKDAETLHDRIFKKKGGKK